MVVIDAKGLTRGGAHGRRPSFHCCKRESRAPCNSPWMRHICQVDQPVPIRVPAFDIFPIATPAWFEVKKESLCAKTVAGFVCRAAGLMKGRYPARTCRRDDGGEKRGDRDEEFPSLGCVLDADGHGGCFMGCGYQHPVGAARPTGFGRPGGNAATLFAQ
ncbi:hypothetical protein DESC_740259 [Desulfosarcina cetonica]|nr:hypothetical protein DESC_740259 [Desulfosarcina cetonica]